MWNLRIYWFVPFFALLSLSCKNPSFQPQMPQNTPTPPNPTPPGVCSVGITLHLTGNLDTGLELGQSGGSGFSTGFAWILPVGMGGTCFNVDSNKISPALSYAPLPWTYFQLSDLTSPGDPSSFAMAHHTGPLALGPPAPLPIDTSSVTALGYAWDQPGNIPWAGSTSKTFTDNAGFTHQVTIVFYQVNDLGAYFINSPPNNQAIYAWYAFDTSMNNPICDWTLIGGTFLFELSPFSNPVSGSCDDRGVSGDEYWGDYLYFNSDGSLASEGAIRSSGGSKVQIKPHLFVSGFSTAACVGCPTDVSALIEVDFGTAGMLGYGLRDGVTGDKAPFSIQ